MKQQLLFNNFEDYRKALDDLREKDNCINGFGDINAEIVLVGEAPGANEIKTGRPFVGSAGKNLDIYLNQLGLSRDNIYITNVIKYRPIKESPKTSKPINRTPTIDEIKKAAPFLINELQIIDPKIIITLGNISLKALTQDYTQTISQSHGKPIMVLNRFLVIPLYHPASIIYNSKLKDIYQNDINVLKQIIP